MSSQIELTENSSREKQVVLICFSKSQLMGRTKRVAQNYLEQPSRAMYTPIPMTGEEEPQSTKSKDMRGQREGRCPWQYEEINVEGGIWQLQWLSWHGRTGGLDREEKMGLAVDG